MRRLRIRTATRNPRTKRRNGYCIAKKLMSVLNCGSVFPKGVA